MEKRWLRLLSNIKRGLASLFVCAVVFLPVAMFAQWAHAVAGPGDPRKATPLPAFQARAIDKTATAPNLFGQPLISVTFDDGWESVYTTAMPLLNRYGIRTTQYVISGTDKQTNYLSDAQIKNIEASGHEIGSHTVSHPDLTKLSPKDLIYQLQQSQIQLRQRFGANAASDFAAPYGATNTQVLTQVSKYYNSERNTNGDYSNGVSQFDVNIAGNFDRYNIIGVSIHRDTTVDDLRNLVAYVEAHNGWLVLTYHQADDPGSDYTLNPQALKAQLAYLSSVPVRIVTITNVISTLGPTSELRY